MRLWGRCWWAGLGRVWVRWSRGAPCRRPGRGIVRRSFGRRGRRRNDRPARTAQGPGHVRAACRSAAMWAPSCGPSVASLQPRPARSYTQTRGPRPRQSTRSRRRRRRHPVLGRLWGCPSRCSTGAAGARPHRSAGRAEDRPWRRAIRVRSGSRRPRRQHQHG